MRTVILTGSNGTIGSKLKKALKKRNLNVICWSRKKIPIDNYDKMFNFVKNSKAEILFHLAADTSLTKQNTPETWKSNYFWTSELAWITKELQIDFIYISSSLVFSKDQKGPFSKNTPPKENYGYGYEKRMSEEQVFKQNPNSKIIRLGWQIGKEGKNTIVNYLENQEKIYASKNWFPSCSFVSETVKFLIDSMYLKPGLYQFNSNEDLSFYEIALNLKKLYNKNWEIIPADEPVKNDLMLNN